MFTAPELSQSEFSSLAKIGSGLFADVVVPLEHVMKLVGYRYVELTEGCYHPTVTGLLRIASGS
jgi:hypothetical protein